MPFFFSQISLPEHTPPGSAVITVTATDRDSGENGRITYKVMSSTKEGFYIDPNNGNDKLASFPLCFSFLHQFLVTFSVE